MKKLLMLAVAVVASFIAMGYTWKDPKTWVEWTYTVWGSEASVDGANPAWGAIAIPSTFGDCPVTSIGYRAFYNCSGLTSVAIPSSVTSIGTGAFSDCSGLRSVTIPEGVTSIDYSAFEGCANLMSVAIPNSVTNIGVSAFCGCRMITSMTIPGGVKSIGQSAFSGCANLMSVTILEGVTSIGDSAFYRCSGLTGVTIPKGVTRIGNGAFSFCSGLTSVMIPSSVTSIGNGAFSVCSGLTSVTIPASVTYIGIEAFADCSGLASVTIPASVTSIGERAFAYCSGLNVDFEGAPPYGVECASIKTDAVIRYNVAYEDEWLPVIEERGFTNATPYVPPLPDGGPYKEMVDGIEWTFTVTVGVSVVGTDVAGEPAIPSSTVGDISIPSTLGGHTVMYVGSYAFEGCSGLTNVTIPSSVTSIGSRAFSDCYGLTSVTIPNSVTSIKGWAFSWCYGLTSVTIPPSVTNIGDGAFCGCSGLAAVDFEGVPPDGIGNASIKTDAAIRYNVAYENEWLPVVKECGWTNATPYELLPDGGPYKEVVDGVEWTFMVKDGVSSLGNEYPITAVPVSTEGELTIPSSLGGRQLRVIGESAFCDCTNITAVTMPNGVISISEAAFYRCRGLVSARIPSSVNVFGKLAFNGCSNLADVYFEGDSIKECPSDAFKNCHWDLIMHVPATWKGRGKTLCGYTVVRDGEEEGVIAANLTITNVVVQYVLNSVQPEIAVPVSGDTGFTTIITEVKSAGAVSVPSEWKDNYPAFESKFGSNFVKALMWKTGKKDGANNDMFVWQDYVAGTDPTNPDDKFTASITMVDGVPVISYTPELSDEQKALRVYKTFGKKQLQDNWTDITNFDGEAKKPYNFFKVTVEMK